MDWPGAITLVIAWYQTNELDHCFGLEDMFVLNITCQPLTTVVVLWRACSFGTSNRCLSALCIFGLLSMHAVLALRKVHAAPQQRLVRAVASVLL